MAKLTGLLAKTKSTSEEGTKILRLSALANPYSIGFDGDRDACIQLFRRWLWYQINIGEHNPNGALKELLS